MTEPSVEEIAREALQRIATHEIVCAERYKQIVANQEDARQERRLMHEQSQKWIEKLSDRMWVSAGGTIVALLGLITTLVATKP
jgi:phage shock protein A